MITLDNNIKFSMIFFLSFVGNAFLFDIAIMPFLLIFVAIILHKQESFINQNNLIIWFLLSILLFYFFSKNVIEPREYDPQYYLWPIYLIFFVCFCGKKYLFDSFRPPLVLSSLLIIFFLIGSYLYKDESGRAYFIFGANVLYRLFIFLAFVQIIHAKSVFTKIIFFLLGFSGVLFTGSRMGLLLSTFLFSIYFLTPFTNGQLSTKKLVRILLLIPILFVYSFFYIEEISNVFGVISESEGLLSRLLLLTGGSISIRIEFLSSFIDHWSFFGTQSQVFDFFYFRDYFPYPHNIIAELIFYYGFFGVIISIIIVFEYIKTFIRFFKKIQLAPIEIAFLIIFPSTLASGDIVDGLMVLFFSMGSFLIWSRKVIIELKRRKSFGIEITE